MIVTERQEPGQGSLDDFSTESFEVAAGAIRHVLPPLPPEVALPVERIDSKEEIGK